MSFSFSSMVRLIVVVALGSTMLAIGLSRLDPPRPSMRFRQTTKYYNLNDYFMNIADRTPRWIDSEDGQISSHPLADGDVLEAASSSPWEDEKGERHVVGRWSRRTTMGPMSVSTDFGLARYSFPGGQLLDHISTEIVPVGPPCWFPGLRARILFAAGDGVLYHYAFEAEPSTKRADPRARADLKPTAVTWRCPRPGQGRVFFSDLTWPEDPRMSAYVVVALREESSGSDSLRCFSRTTLWWLKLNLAGTEIVDAGRLLDGPGEFAHGGSLDQRSPTVGTLPGGKLALAYLAEGHSQQNWELRIAPIEFEKDGGAPKVNEAKSRLLSSTCQPAHPSFSADGHWLNAIAESSGSKGRLIRLPIAKVFSSN